MRISDELKSKQFLQFQNLVLQHNRETDSTLVHIIYSDKHYGIGEDQAAFLGWHLGGRIVGLDRRTIIKFEDCLGRRIPRALLEGHYHYFITDKRVYQLAAYVSPSEYETLKIPRLDETFKEQRIIFKVTNGRIDTYSLSVMQLDIEVVKHVNQYCKEVNKYLRIAAALAHLPCQVSTYYSYNINTFVGRGIQERLSAFETAGNIVADIEVNAGHLSYMPLAMAHIAYRNAFVAPSISMRHVYVR